ncbi:hypothetical protein C8R42DRAFT_778150 [Lentinula raphanica]|nr:hypothetical protein C8R42DRAFT_778150 [Lentinula raphanica]
MRGQLSLPNELLHDIIDYIAFFPKPPNSVFVNESSFKRASPELLALSLVSRRFRQVCLPFLFENIRIGSIEDVQNLENHLVLLSRFTRILLVCSEPKTEDQKISQILPQLEQLSQVEIENCWARIGLLRSVLAHPAVTLVLVHSLPDESICNDDLSKVILSHHTSSTMFTTFNANVEKYLNQGMKLGCLEFQDIESGIEVSDFLDDQTGYQILSGPIKIILNVSLYFTLSSHTFMSVFSAPHSNVKELWFIEDGEGAFQIHAPPFLSTFIEESQRQGLKESFNINSVCLRRVVGPDRQVSQEWFVVGITLKPSSKSTSESLIEILMLLSSSFPKLEDLTLYLYDNITTRTYHANNLARAFGHFLRLKSLTLSGAYRHLDFVNHIHPAPFPSTRTPSIKELDDALASAKAGLVRFASLVAKEGRSLDRIYIDDRGDHEPYYAKADPEIYLPAWFLEGWLYVLNINRDIGGTLEGRIDDTYGTRSLRFSFETARMPLPSNRLT